MQNSPPPVLVTWIAVDNDPFDSKTKEGQRTHGPTLTLLFDPESPFCGRIRDVVLLNRKTNGSDNGREQRAVAATQQEIGKLDKNLRIHLEPWSGEDPTDHRAIFEFLREKLPQIRRRFAGRQLIIHNSPGSPSMQTIWLLMAETGFVEPPFQLVKSYRPIDRRGRPAVVPVELGIDTFYKVYKASHPSQVAAEEQSIALDPQKFRSEKMRQLFAEARRFAQVKVPVLILGERGTGKSTLASWMRLYSPYRKPELDGNWPAVACGQYNPETMRAELFGHKRGSFTGASQDKLGLLATAHGDTLFLDEIGDVSRDLQRLLIKALEEKRFFALGDNKPTASDFRLLSATNLDDKELSRRLDPDFRDRVNTLTLRMPPLREIKEELGWLWDSTFAAAAARSGVRRGQVQFADSHHHRVVLRLREHPLPGNLRDLFRVAYRIVAARVDAHAPLSPADAVEYGLAALADVVVPDCQTTSRAVARCFADAVPLDGIIAQVGRVPTDDLVRDLQAFIAQEIRRISKTSDRPIEELCDVSDRTLRSWVRHPDDGSNLPTNGSPDPKNKGRRPGRSAS